MNDGEKSLKITVMPNGDYLVKRSMRLNPDRFTDSAEVLAQVASFLDFVDTERKAISAIEPK